MPIICSSCKKHKSQTIGCIRDEPRTSCIEQREQQTQDSVAVDQLARTSMHQTRVSTVETSEAVLLQVTNSES